MISSVWRVAKHAAMAGTGMIGVAMGDQRPIHRTHGIDIEITRPDNRDRRAWERAGPRA